MTLFACGAALLMSCARCADRVVCLDGTTGGQEEPHRAEDPNPTPSAQSGVAEALRAPAPCVRSTLPPRPAAFLSLAQARTSGRRGISPRVRVDINGQSACLSKPSGPTGCGCGCVWETQHMLLPRSLAQGSDFGLQEWRLAVTSQQCQAQNNNRPQLVSRTTPDTWRERRVLRPCPAISRARP